MSLPSRSTPEQISACENLVRKTRDRICQLKADGKKVHIIWDVDHVLANGRSDDVFIALDLDVSKYHDYEERLLAQPLEEGPWADLARQCGTLHDSQDISTARSGYSVLRVSSMVSRWNLPILRQLFVGHQSKFGSYKILLEPYVDDPSVHIFGIDDSPRHVTSFCEAVYELGLTGRAEAIQAPQIRLYDPAEIEREAEDVLSVRGTEPRLLTIRPESRPGDHGRTVLVVPRPRDFIAKMFEDAANTAWGKAVFVHLPKS